MFDNELLAFLSFEHRDAFRLLFNTRRIPAKATLVQCLVRRCIYITHLTKNLREETRGPTCVGMSENEEEDKEGKKKEGEKGERRGGVREKGKEGKEIGRKSVVPSYEAFLEKPSDNYCHFVSFVTGNSRHFHFAYLFAVA